MSIANMSHIHYQAVVPAGKFEVFKYLTDPGELGALLKDSIRVKWQNPGVELQPDAEFLFLMSRFGVEQPIRFRVEKVVIGNQLTYHQLEGLFKNWLHTIKFEEHGANETLVTDLVEYEVPFGLIGKVADDVWVRSELKRILADRLQRVKEHFTQLN